MSDSQPTPPGSGKSKSNKPETPTSNRIILILLLAATVMLVFYPLISGRSTAETISFSDFHQKVESGELNPTNVHELFFRFNSITYQDQPEPEEGTESDVKPEKFQIPAGSIHSEAREALRVLVKEKGIPYEFEPGPSNWDAYLMLALIAAPFILLFILMLRRVGGAGGALAFGRSRGKVYAQDDLGITFDDVAGIDEAVDELKEVVDFLKSH